MVNSDRRQDGTMESSRKRLETDQPNAGAVDRPGQIETRGVDVVPDAERHGRAIELLPVWLASNTAYLYIILGGTMMLLGLTVWQAIAVVVAGNLFWVLAGVLAISGPAAGTPSVVITRAIYGTRGNRVLGAGLTWVTCVAFEAINLAIGTLSAFALAQYAGLDVTTPVKWLILIAVGSATFTISIFGHATIVRLSWIFSVLLGGSMLILSAFVFAHGNFHYHPADPLRGKALVAAMFGGLTIIASGPLSWATGADYARYLPRNTSRIQIAGWTALGGAVPAILLGIVGVVAGSVVNMTDPQLAMKAILPSWFYVAFLVALVIGSITNNVLTSYSSGLALQSAGLRASRARSVFLDALIGGGLCAYAIFASSFLTAMNNALELSVTYLGPGMAIYAADVWLRRNKYDGRKLHDATRSGPFWYRGGINPAGATALILGTAAALLCAHTTYVTGPVASALGNTDISSLIGPAIAAITYVTIWQLSTSHNPVPSSVPDPELSSR